MGGDIRAAGLVQGGDLGAPFALTRNDWISNHTPPTRDALKFADIDDGVRWFRGLGMNESGQKDGL